ncbi:PhzF family phenazine biosynthesis protein [Streptomyces sp. NPDC008079]|uniref:PhzF family phenazine biosynthesis protein n=1 Tax=Streptomyces sp. NPDC008079 TaxID=3364806 RepID=UPI0036EC4021
MTTPSGPDILRYTAFSDDPEGGNPAGVVLDASALDAPGMLAVAADVGYSETAFVTATDGRTLTVRYFSPKAEVSFCGHATLATAVAVADRLGAGDLLFRTRAGDVPVTVSTGPGGTPLATMTSVEPYVEDIAPDALAEALAALDWPAADLDPAFPPRVAYAGARHLVLAAATRERLADLAYDFDRLAALMTAVDLTTVQLLWRESPSVFHVRDPFPVGGVVEDPATGAAALALGAYLRDLGLVAPPATLTLHQGHDLGRPATLTVTVPPSATPYIQVTGTAVPIPA